MGRETLVFFNIRPKREKYELQEISFRESVADERRKGVEV